MTAADHSTPHTDIALERALIGSLIAMGDPQSVREIISTLPEGTFWDTEMEHLCTVLTRITPDPEHPHLDENAVIGHLVTEEGRQYDTVAPAIVALASGADPRKHIAADYAPRLINLAAARELNGRLRRQVQALNDSGDAHLVAASATSDLDDFRQGLGNTSVAWNVWDAHEQLLEEVERLRKFGGEPELSLGSKALDAVVGGVHRGHQMVLAARPGIGKTAAGLDLARAVLNQGYGVIIISMEMSNGEIWKRLVAAEAGVLHNSLSGRGSRIDEDLTRAAQIIGEKLPQWDKRLMIVDGPSTTARIRTKVDEQRILWQREGITPGVMMVDYAQLLKHPDGGADKTLAQKVGEASKDLRRIAQTGEPMVSLLLSQINRRGSDNPSIDDLKDSGALEEDADVVVILSRDTDEESPDYRDIRYDVAKNRHGESRVVVREHQLEKMRFFDRANRQTPPPSTDTW